LEPFPTRLIQLVENSRFKALQDHAVGTLYVAIGLWVCHSRPIHTDVEIVAKLQEFPARELGRVVGDDGVWHSEAVDDIGEECLP
jgi:hypothetical protein